MKNKIEQITEKQLNERIKNIVTKQLNEGKKEIPQSFIDKVAKLTYLNDHNGARVLVAETLLKKTKYVTIYKGFQAINDLLRQTPKEIIDIRLKIDKMVEYELDNRYSNMQDLRDMM